MPNTAMPSVMIPPRIASKTTGLLPLIAMLTVTSFGVHTSDEQRLLFHCIDQTIGGDYDEPLKLM